MFQEDNHPCLSNVVYVRIESSLRLPWWRATLARCKNTWPIACPMKAEGRPRRLWAIEKALQRLRYPCPSDALNAYGNEKLIRYQ